MDLNGATATLFSESADLINTEEWLLQIDYAASKKSRAQKHWEARRKIVEQLLSQKLLPDVSGLRYVEPTKTRRMTTVEFKTPYGWIPIHRISHGYRTLIAWVVDLACRMFARFPDSSDPLAEPAVVLVDEIDLHLHPQWQRQVMSYLTERFPNTQFIVTAHSPLIVQAASSVNANVAVLRREGNQVVIENNVEAIQGWRVDQILTSDLFGLQTARPPEYDKIFKKREKLLIKSRLTKKEKEDLKKLNQEVHRLPGGETAAEAQRMVNLIEETNQLLKQRIASKS